MPKLRHSFTRIGSKHLPGHRTIAASGLYLHGQRGGSIGSILKSALTGIRSVLPKILGFFKGQVKRHGPGLVKTLAKTTRDTVLPAAIDKISDKLGVDAKTKKGLKKLSAMVGKKGTAELEKLANQGIRNFTGNGLSLHGQGMKKF